MGYVALPSEPDSYLAGVSQSYFVSVRSATDMREGIDLSPLGDLACS